MSLPYFEYYVKDMHAKAAHLNLAEEGAYHRLLRLCWMRNTCSIPSDEAWIFKHMRVRNNTEEQQIVRDILEEFFTLKAAEYLNKRLTEVHANSNEKHARRVEAGKKSAENRKKSQKNIKKTKPLKTKENLGSNAGALMQQPEPEPEPEPYISATLNRGVEKLDWKTTLDSCIDAARPALNEANIPLMDFSQIKRWIEDPKSPCDLEQDIIPTLERVALRNKGRNIRGWGYFRDAVIEARDLRLQGLPKPKERSHDNGNQQNNTGQSYRNRQQAASESRINTLGEVLADREAKRGMAEDV